MDYKFRVQETLRGRRLIEKVLITKIAIAIPQVISKFFSIEPLHYMVQSIAIVTSTVVVVYTYVLA